MILDKFKLDGKVAIVTGASRGLGRAMAVALAQAGADVAVVARSDLSETVKRIEKANRKCAAVNVDIAKENAHNEIVDVAIKHFGRIDILVNNAGIIRRNPFPQFTEKDWDDVINVNLRSLFLLSQAVTKIFLKQGGGKIINIASLLSFQGGILVPSYTASKSAVMGLTKIMANELASKNINVNAIAPGYMATEITQPLRDDTERNKAILQRIPAGRWGEPEDLAGAVVFLASDASNYINGYTIAVDGGWLAR